MIPNLQEYEQMLPQNIGPEVLHSIVASYADQKITAKYKALTRNFSMKYLKNLTNQVLDMNNI